MSEDRIILSSELATELAQTEDSTLKYNTGFPTLDRLLDGVEAGELIIVSGPSDGGKTTMLMSITNNMEERGYHSCWFTLEVTPRQFLKKLIKKGGRLPDFYIPRKDFEDSDDAFVKVWEQEHKKHYERMDWIEVKILEAIAKAKADGKILQAIFIDHIHQIFSISKVERNISLELGDMVARIKHIAIQNNLVVFLIAHTTDDKQNINREPRLMDIRDSGLISRLADTVVMIWRIPNDDDGTSTRIKECDEMDNRAKLKVVKNRREGTKGWFLAQHQNHHLTELSKADYSEADAIMESL